MDQDDPEKRSTDPEHQFAEQTLGAALPPVGPDRAQPGSASNPDSAQRYFSATAVPSTRQKYSTFAGLFVVSSVYPISQEFWEGSDVMTAHRPFIFPAMLVGLVVLWFLALRRLFTKKLVLCVTTDNLTVDKRPGDVFPLRGAELGQWRSTWGRGGHLAGRALCLTSGPHRFVLSDGDSRPTNEVPIEGPQVSARHLDAWTTSSAFDELLAIVGRARE